MPLLRFPLPSLVNLHVNIPHPPWLSNFLELFPTISPGVEVISIFVSPGNWSTLDTPPNCITRWRNLSRLSFFRITLNVDDIVHLSRTPALTELRFALKASLPAFDSPLIFSNLRDFSLFSLSSEPISKFLLQIRLPALTSFDADICNCPSSQDFTSFLANIPISNSGHTIESLRLYQPLPYPREAALHSSISLEFDDLQPWMAFNNLHRIEIDIAYDVGLTDSKLLALASAWPKLQHLIINSSGGWNIRGGITPGGLVELLRTCRLLREIALRLDTRGYTEVPPNHVLANLGWTFPSAFSINVVDSAIEAESVPAVAAFLCGFAGCFGSYFTLRAWDCAPRMDPWLVPQYAQRWDEVERRVNEALGCHPEQDDG